MEADSIPKDAKQNVDAESIQFAKMEADSIPKDVKQNVDAETKQLQKMSLSDPPQEQNKKDIDDEDEYYQFQKSFPYWDGDDYFERLSFEELMMVEVRPQQEWLASHTCTMCGVLDDCMCKRLARLENMEFPQIVQRLQPMYGPPLRL